MERRVSKGDWYVRFFEIIVFVKLCYFSLLRIMFLWKMWKNKIGFPDFGIFWCFVFSGKVVMVWNGVFLKYSFFLFWNIGYCWNCGFSIFCNFSDFEIFSAGIVPVEKFSSFFRIFLFFLGVFIFDGIVRYAGRIEIWCSGVFLWRLSDG